MRKTFAALLAASVVLVAACGGDDDSADEATAQEPAAEESTVEESMVEESTVEESMAEESTVEESTVEESTVEESTVEESTAEESTVEESPADGGVTIDDAGRLLPAACSSDANVASEADGVAEDSVNVAGITIDFKPLADIGFSATDRDPNAILQVFIDEINDNGGVCGRTIDLQQVKFNILTGEAGQACIEATEDRTNLMVTTSSYGEVLCLTDAGLPVIASNDDIDAERMDAANGLLYNRAPSLEDQYIATVQAAEQEGALEGKVGVWYGSIYPAQTNAAEDIVLPMLDEMGVDYVAFRTDYTGPNDPAGNQALVTAATEFVAQKVDTVLQFVQNTNQTGIQTELAAQGLNPRYFSAPIAGNSSNELFADRFGTREIADGQQWVTYTYGRSEIDASDPVSASCHEIWTRRTGEEVEGLTFDYATIADSCVHADQIAAALSLAGAELTRESFLAAVAQLPPHHLPTNIGEITWSVDDHYGSDVFSVQVYDGASNSVTTSSDTFTVDG